MSGGGPRVERVEPPGGPPFLRKRQPQPRKWQQEVDALRAWGPRLQPWVPRLLAADPKAGTIDVELRPGRAPTSPSRETWREAGRFLARMHGLEVPDPDPVPLEEALARRLDAFVRAAAPVWGAGTARAVAEAVAEHLAGARRVPCHRDFAPYNWLVDAAGRLSVVDFEHARLDWAPLDRARLDGQSLLADAAARTAFDAGYGSPGSWARRCALARWEAARTVVWGIEHSDPEMERRGRAAWAVASTARE